MYCASVSPSLRAIFSMSLLPIGPLPSPETCVSRSLIVIEPKVNSPTALRERFGLTGSAAVAINRPMAVAFARLEPVPRQGSAANYAGSVYRVEVEVGHRRVISFLPLVGSFFEE